MWSGMVGMNTGRKGWTGPEKTVRRNIMVLGGDYNKSCSTCGLTDSYKAAERGTKTNAKTIEPVERSIRLIDQQ